MPESATAARLILPEPFESEIDPSSYNQFLYDLCRLTDIKQAVFTFPFSCDDPLQFLDALDPQQEFLFYMEKPDSNHVIAAGGALLKISESGSDRFIKTQRSIASAETETLHFNGTSRTELGIHFLGGFSFFDETGSSDWQNFDSASMTLARCTIIKKDDNCTISIALSLMDTCSPEQIHQKLKDEFQLFQASSASVQYSSSSNKVQGDASNNISNAGFKEWRETINSAKCKIAEQKLEKVVAARELKTASDKDYEHANIIHHLREEYPGCCTFSIRHKNSKSFIGSSPELLLSYHGNLLQTESLAGSAARGITEKEDLALENKLMNSPKNIAEHNFVMKDIEQQLHPFVRNMNRNDHPKIKKLANVQHLLTPIQAEMSDDTSPISILGKLHPTPAVGGYPQKKAAEFIQQTTSFNRGWFGAPIGWMNTKGKGEFTVAIRSGLVGKTKARLFAGCGIVADSDAESEWQESKLKFIPMLSALNHE